MTHKTYLQEIVLLKKSLLSSSVFVATLLAGCAAPQKSDWVKEGVSKDGKETALSECSYQIRLNKTSAMDVKELTNLCMRGKGFRMKPVA
ncbi:MAG: hypothetical protein C0428_18240 [Polaromonas sp.]|nr:hypothetical protein [Polaromonas sp.]